MHQRFDNLTMQRDINITIKLEGLTPFSIKIPLDQEQSARDAERIVNHLFNSWKDKLSNLSHHELMGRIAFQLARKFEALNADMLKVGEELDRSERELDAILLDLD